MQRALSGGVGKLTNSESDSPPKSLDLDRYAEFSLAGTQSHWPAVQFMLIFSAYTSTVSK